jgi:subtilase family serine protease
MSPSRFFLAPRPVAIRRRIRPKVQAPVACEMLETRQLLSIGTIASPVSSSIAQPLLQVVPMAGGGSSAYSPQQIASAYEINGISFSGVSGNGAGQTIAIVEAYHDPNIQADLTAFDAHFGLTAPPSFTVDNLGGTTTDAGWALETALDVEWAHAVAPQANIVLVEAADPSLNSLLNAVRTAASQPNVSVVSMSWGTSEFYGEWNVEGAFTTPGGHANETFIAASGDSGAWSGPSFPAVSPNVLAVGGSTLALGTATSYGWEAGWTGSTGGFSGLDNSFQYGLSVPSYQVSTLKAAGLDYGLRTTPDVSFNASPDTGYAVYDSVSYGGSSGWFDVGGTSAAAPAWAGLVAITDQGLVASGQSTLTTTQLLTNLYSLPSSDFHDITSGFNGYHAGSGYDLATGLGTPQANLLVPGLLAANGGTVSPSARTTAASGQQATTSPILHNAAVTSASPTPSASVVATATAGVSFSPGVTGLPVQSQTASTTTGSSGMAAPGSSSVGSSTALSAAPIVLGQGMSPSTALVTSGVRDISDQPDSGIDVFEAGKGADTGTPDLPMPQAPRHEVPMPQPMAPDEVVPGPVPGASPEAEPMIPSWDSPDSTLVEVDAAIDRLAWGTPSVRIDPTGGIEERRSITTDAEHGGAAPGLVAAGATILIGQRARIGERRRRTTSRSLRSSGR